jgi:deoxyribodipyrimidine photo-lyase
LQASEAATAELAARGYRTESGEPFLRSSPRSLLGRLHWHCHFIQKLESEPEIEHRCFHRAYEALRPAEADPARLLAWCEGRTGYPLVDACMRSLRATGWLNFRMRAMLVSFAAYDLWLDWRTFRDYLARQFLDYEPGIHFSQLQMQSGVTGINAIRIYNPVKQGLDQDPAGEFIRRWVPELARVPGPLIHTPWRLTPLEQKETVSAAYPPPIIDHVTAMRAAKAQITALRAGGTTVAEARRVFAQHGSRRRRPDPRAAARRARGVETKRPPLNPDQLHLKL